MIRITLWALLPLWIVCPGCVASLTPGGRAVTIVPLDVPATCQKIRFIRIPMTNDEEMNLQGAKNKLRNRAAELGANVVRWDRIFPHAIVGMAFRCPEQTPPPVTKVPAKKP